MVSKLDIAKNELIKNMNNGLELLKQINSCSDNLSPGAINSIYELSFLKIYLSWESFISRVFILFMLGEKTESGYAPKRYVMPKDENHAYKIIKGSLRFVDWLNLEFIRQQSVLFFENGEPFKPALYSNSTKIEVLTHMKILRNKIVHASKEANEKYEQMLRNEFGFASNTSPGEFLSRMREREPKMFYIEYYKSILEAASNDIIR